MQFIYSVCLSKELHIISLTKLVLSLTAFDKNVSVQKFLSAFLGTLYALS